MIHESMLETHQESLIRKSMGLSDYQYLKNSQEIHQYCINVMFILDNMLAYNHPIGNAQVVCSWYISGIYCQLGDYISPTPY